MSRLSSMRGQRVKIEGKKTIQALIELFPGLEHSKAFMPSVSLVSEQRRLASHSVRPPALNYPAFSQFTTDLAHCVEAMNEILTMLERECGVSGAKMYNRHEAKKQLPNITRQADPH